VQVTGCQQQNIPNSVKIASGSTFYRG